MFGFIKKVFNVATTFFGCNLLNVNPFKCLSMNNHKCKIRLRIISFDSNEPLYYPYSIKMNEFGGICKDIYDPYAKLIVSDVAKNINIEVFNLMLRNKETRHIKWHKTCKCRLDASVCNNQQR